jgi:hypothetical protein
MMRGACTDGVLVSAGRGRFGLGVGVAVGICSGSTGLSGAASGSASVAGSFVNVPGAESGVGATGVSPTEVLSLVLTGGFCWQPAKQSTDRIINSKANRHKETSSFDLFWSFSQAGLPGISCDFSENSCGLPEGLEGSMLLWCVSMSAPWIPAPARCGIPTPFVAIFTTQIAEKKHPLRD